MATYTSNLNLYMPDSTDDFGEFREEHNDNMVKIDNAIGGGGGSGGHTIIDPNGNSLPQESGLQFTGGVTVTDDSVNGKTVVDISGGGGNVYGAFIDTNRVLATYNSSGGASIASYTATEDCFVAFYVFGKGSQTCRIYVDSEEILTLYFQNDSVFSPTLYLKKGQVLSFSSFDYWSFHYTAYGLTQGTSGIFTPIIYSDTERVVGVWRDNKPLYQRTWEFGSPVLVSYSSWTNTVVDSSDIENIITVKAKHADGTCFEGIMADPTVSGHTLVGLQTTRNGAEANVKTLTLQYTKISDVAGSGNWNTDGVPTVHYSTSEQVIGTWIDGKPIYQCTWSGTKTTNAEEVVISGLVTLDTLVDSKVIFKGNTGAQIAQYFRDASDFGRCWFDNNGIHMDLGNSYPIRPVTWYITLQYTKTTD